MTLEGYTARRMALSEERVAKARKAIEKYQRRITVMQGWIDDADRSAWTAYEHELATIWDAYKLKVDALRAEYGLSKSLEEEH